MIFVLEKLKRLEIFLQFWSSDPPKPKRKSFSLHFCTFWTSQESIIDTPRDVLQDRRRVVGLSVDVHWNTVGFCKGLMKIVSYIQSNIKEILDTFVNLSYMRYKALSEPDRTLFC